LTETRKDIGLASDVFSRRLYQVDWIEGKHPSAQANLGLLACESFMFSVYIYKGRKNQKVTLSMSFKRCVAVGVRKTRRFSEEAGHYTWIAWNF